MRQIIASKKTATTNHALHITACAVMVGLAVIAAFLNNSVQQSGMANAASVNVASFMREFAPGTVHEALPYGVPSEYAWQKRSSMGDELVVAAPDATTNYMNLWGQLFTYDTDSQPANTRVEIAKCQLWGYVSGQWKVLLNSSPGDLHAGSWSPDYKQADDMTPPGTLWPGDGGAVSLVTNPGRVTTFWNGGPEWRAQVDGSYTEFASMCSVRLQQVDKAQPDDRANAKYLLGMGADWRKEDGSCGAEGCKSVGTGKFVKVKNEWQRVMFSTLSSSDLQNKTTLLPSEALINPDGLS